MRGMSESFDADVLVLGLGPAGASAAGIVAQSGLRVIALDRNSQAGYPVQCAEFVPSMLGQTVGGLTESYLQDIHAMATFLEKQDKTYTPNFRGTMVSRAIFDRVLIDKAEQAGAICWFAASIQNIDDNGVVRLSSGEILGARAIIGADGPKSIAGRVIGQINRDCVETRQITVPLLEQHSATDIFLSNEIVGGYGWLFPKGDQANLGLGILPAWKAELKPLLERLHADLVVAGRVGDDVLSYTGGLIPVGGMLDPVGSFGVTPIVLAGDAAGLTNPITGAGISAAVISGDMAGKAVAAYLSGSHNALEGYREDLEDLFGASLRRALKSRNRLLERYADGGKPDLAALKSAWIAYPEYWAA